MAEKGTETTYDWDKDWYFWRTDMQTGHKRYKFESRDVKDGSRCRREIFADNMQEATAELSPPRW